jgi:hypothetical protein
MNNCSFKLQVLPLKQMGLPFSAKLLSRSNKGFFCIIAFDLKNQGFF